MGYESYRLHLRFLDPRAEGHDPARDREEYDDRRKSNERAEALSNPE